MEATTEKTEALKITEQRQIIDGEGSHDQEISEMPSKDSTEGKEQESIKEASNEDYEIINPSDISVLDSEDDGNNNQKKDTTVNPEHVSSSINEEDPQKTATGDPEGSTEKEERGMYAYTPLEFGKDEMRFLVVKPHPDGPGNIEDPEIVECSFSFSSLSESEPYTYVVNTRGNSLAWSPISIEGPVIWTTRNIPVFLNHIRSKDTTHRLWFRDVCLDSKNPQEKSRYWTPEWMKVMEDHASNVIDLSEVMGELWDQGKLPQLIPPRPKEWLSERDPSPTKHHPSTIELQVLPRDARLPHRYLPLDYVLDEIRLITLLPAANYADPIEALFGYKVLHDDTTYHCVSHSGGTDEPSCLIYLNNQTFYVRKDLDAFLRAVRFPNNRIVLWIDEVCIDQSNIRERDRQLSRKLEIYEGADRILTWIGEADTTSDMALDFIGNFIKTPVMRHRDDGEWDVDDIETLPQMLAALYKLLLRPYFRHVHVMQELALATTPMILCGKKIVSADDLDKAAYHLSTVLHSDMTMPAKMMEADTELKSVSYREISFIRRALYVRHLQGQGRESSHWYMTNPEWLEIGDNCPGILDLVVMARDFKSPSPYDKVFSVWNLARDTEGMVFKLDYTKSPSDTWLNFATTVAQGNRKLDVICAAEPLVRDGLDIPSWCPDWSAPSTVSSLIRLEEIPNVMMWIIKNRGGPVYWAAGKGDLTPRFSFDGRTLECAGIVADSVRVVGPYEPEFPDMKRYIDWLNVVSSEMVFSDDDSSSGSSHDKTFSAFWSMLAGDVPGVWGSKESPPVTLPDGKVRAEMRTVCLKPEECRLRLHNTSLDVCGVMTRGRRLIITENGLMGLAPHYVEAGQKLAVLNGCSVPVILHENEDGTYRFAGSCFVQGWMEGELLNDYGDTPEDAWEMFDLSGRLTIV